MYSMNKRVCDVQFAVFSIIAGLLFFSTSLSFAQVRPPVPPINLSYFRVDFVQAGARSAALGGAFIGAAQDETAAAINPAGLTYLKSAGASLHQRVANLDFEEPEGAVAAANRKTGFRSHIFDQNLVVVFFPIKRFTFATLHQVGFDNRFTFETDQFLTTGRPSTTRQILGGLGNFPGRKVGLNLRLVNDGVSVAYRINKRLSLGVTGKISVLNIRLNEQTFLDPLVGDGVPLSRGNQPENTYSITTINERVTDPSFSFGAMSKIILDKLFVGAVLNLNPSFALNSNIFFPKYKLGNEIIEAESARPEFKFSVPNSAGAGIYFVPTSGIRFTFDVVRVQYTDLLSENDLNIVADDELNPQTGLYEDPDGSPDLTVDDVTEFHAGVEFLVRPRVSFAKRFGLIPIRIGIHTNPGHRIYATGKDPDLKRLFPKAEDRVHFSFGTGFLLNSYLKFDGSITISADSFEFIASTLITLPL